jgi:AbrB family looped-hinge helix DNA binding protein
VKIPGTAAKATAIFCFGGFRDRKESYLLNRQPNTFYCLRRLIFSWFCDILTVVRAFPGCETQQRRNHMNLAKMSSDGQVTVPAEIRRLLNLKEGDKLRFSRRENGDVVIDNASINAILKAQKAFAGVAEELGNPSEEEIQSWVDEIRYGRKDA